MFEAKYLWKYLSVQGMVYIIRIVSLRPIFEKNGDYVICTLSMLLLCNRLAFHSKLVTMERTLHNTLHNQSRAVVFTR